MSKMRSVPIDELGDIFCQILQIFESHQNSPHEWTEYDNGVRKKIVEFMRNYTEPEDTSKPIEQERKK
jgi:hypothetical protein